MEINTGKQLLALIHEIGLNCNQFSKVLGTDRSNVSLWTNDKRRIPRDVREHALIIRWAVLKVGVEPRDLPTIIRKR